MLVSAADEASPAGFQLHYNIVILTYSPKYFPTASLCCSCALHTTVYSHLYYRCINTGVNLLT